MTRMPDRPRQADEGGAGSLTTQLRKIREKFLCTVPERCSAALALLDQLDGTDPEIAAIRHVHCILHELSGTAGTLGASDVTRAIAPAFAAAECCAGAKRLPSKSEITLMRDYIVRVRAMVEAQLREMPAMRPHST